MMAKIVDKDKREYYSTVFAICENGFDTAVIVYDEEKYQFSFVKVYRYTKGLVRGVFIIDCDEKDFVKNRNIKISSFKTIKHISGYDWLVENNELFINIFKNQQVDECYKKKAAEMNKGIVINEWTLVKNEQDVENLMEAAWGFHDGIIEKIIFNDEYDNAEVVFSGCWGSKVSLLFQFDIEIHFVKYSIFSGEIMDSNVFFESGFVYWVDDYSIKSEAELTKAKDSNYFKARALSWKQETEYYTEDYE